MSTQPNDNFKRSLSFARQLVNAQLSLSGGVARLYLYGCLRAPFEFNQAFDAELRVDRNG